MAVWHEVEAVLVRLRQEHPGAFVASAPPLDAGIVGGPAPGPPFTVWLAPWATGVAEQLHQQFGGDVHLVVGALPYPLSILSTAPPPPPLSVLSTPLPTELLDPREIAAWLDGPAVVRSGQTVEHGLLLRNLTGRDLQICTYGFVDAVVVDPHTGEVVGVAGKLGLPYFPLVVVSVPPGQTERVPLLIGTSSCTPRLGYVVPPGDWGVRAVLTLGEDRDSPGRQTNVLPLTITA
jgi:hypothetical protein